jgi:hypothetical protein
MPFQDTTRDKLMDILKWPASSVDYVTYLQSLMDDVVTATGEDAIARIEDYITEYEDAEAAVTAATVSTQASMIKADVVAWNPKLTARSQRSRVNRAVSRIKQALGVSPDPFGFSRNLDRTGVSYGLDIVDTTHQPLRLRRG